MKNQFLALTERGKNGPARWLGGTLNILFFWLVVGGILSTPFLLLAGFVQSNADFSQSDPFWTYIGINVSFFGIWLGLWLTLRFIHQRKFRTLITPATKISWKRIAQGFVVWVALLLVFQLVEVILFPGRVVFTFDPARWLFFLPFVLILTPLQTSAEELLFRGYWLQGTGRLVQNIILLSIINGILFGLPHMLNPEVVENPGSTLILFLNYLLIGAIFAYYTLRDRRLELVLGAHAANNLYSALLVNYTDSALPTPAIFTNTVLDANLGLVGTIIVSVAFYLIVFRLLGRGEQPVLETNEPVESQAPLP
jgi:membrane protease YdiL (CAAX protease family)